MSLRTCVTSVSIFLAFLLLAACSGSSTATGDGAEPPVDEPSATELQAPEAEPTEQLRQLPDRVPPIGVVPAEDVIDDLRIGSHDQVYWLIDDEDDRRLLARDLGGEEELQRLGLDDVDLAEQVLVTAIVGACQPEDFWLEVGQSELIIVVKQSPTDCAQQQYWMPIFAVSRDGVEPLTARGPNVVVVESEGEGDSTDRFRFDWLRERQSFPSTGLARVTDVAQLNIEPGSFVVVQGDEAVEAVSQALSGSRLEGSIEDAMALGLLPVVVGFEGCRVGNVWSDVVSPGGVVVTVRDRGALCDLPKGYVAVVGAAIGARQQLDDGLVLLTVDRFGGEVRSTAVEVELGDLLPS